MSESRRSFFRSAAVLGAGLMTWAEGLRAQKSAKADANERTSRAPAKERAGPPLRMESPDIGDLAFTMDGDTKVFHLIAEPVKRKIVPWKTLDIWGYNGSSPGPTIQVQQGDRVRIEVENRLPESTTMHWHGLEVPIEQDGVPYISQKPIAPGETYAYEFTVHQEGTFFYHAHSAMQEMIGLIGMFIAHPHAAYTPRVGHDYGIVLQEWAVLPNSSVPNTAGMEFNWLTFNGVAAQSRVVEFEAKYPGAWMIHCHLPHHMMNSMMDLLRDRQIMTADQTEPTALSQMQALAARVGFEHQHPSPVSPDAEKTPGFPQDAFMEMGMDELLQKPETHGLQKNWSAGMMGMMTMVRVLPDKEFNEIAQMKKSPAHSEEHTREHHHS